MGLGFGKCLGLWCCGTGNLVWEGGCYCYCYYYFDLSRTCLFSLLVNYYYVIRIWVLGLGNRCFALVLCLF